MIMMVVWAHMTDVKDNRQIGEGDADVEESLCGLCRPLHVGTTITCIILIVNLPPEQEAMDQFMREKKINKSNNVIMQSHYRIYTDESQQHDDTSQTRSVKFCTCHC